MTNYAKLDHKNRLIVMDRTFAKNAEIIGSAEYDLLQECRKAYPKYAVVQRSIKKNEGQNRYDGMTFDAMREYIKRHEAAEHIANPIALALKSFNPLYCAYGILFP